MTPLVTTSALLACGFAGLVAVTARSNRLKAGQGPAAVAGGAAPERDRLWDIAGCGGGTDVVFTPAR
ncbi:hypothetical protein Snoj_00810 [Streptomyces nojiriensis]|uniref:Uncharacterized protein n=1 Tax=Streptomyces nojiriensis TaxID=66374 RepID=A0ABQ3SDF6_9ACTN|nr:hypothetical protein GCM10010205_75980 [Streptomyces nojiriensis]GHI66163.1 hypothetical protein Snoj_00810 [Streptomyces nojiriensis]